MTRFTLGAKCGPNSAARAFSRCSSQDVASQPNPAPASSSIRLLVNIEKLARIEQAPTQLLQAVTLHEVPAQIQLVLLRRARQRQSKSSLNPRVAFRANFPRYALGERLGHPISEVVVHQAQGLQRGGGAGTLGRLHRGYRAIERFEHRVAR